jgi:hypothetical protein
LFAKMSLSLTSKRMGALSPCGGKGLIMRGGESIIDRGRQASPAPPLGVQFSSPKYFGSADYRT